MPSWATWVASVIMADCDCIITDRGMWEVRARRMAMTSTLE